MHVHPFRIYSRSESKVVRNRAQLWMFFSPFQILGGGAGGPSKSYTHFITPASRHVVWKKFCEDTPTSPEVIGANTLNFKPHFKFSRLFFGGGTPVSLDVRAWCVEIWGRSTPKGRSMVPQISAFSGSKLTYNSLQLVDQSSQNFFNKHRSNRSRSYVFPILDILPRSEYIRDQSLKWYKIGRKFECFGRQFFALPQFLDLHDKIQQVFDHEAKFHFDWSMDLGERAAKKKHLLWNIRPSETTVSGGLTISY